jgi:hypothetical protein
LYDGLVRLLRHGECAGSFNAHFTVKDQQKLADLGEPAGLHVWDWLEREGYDDVLGEVLFKSLFPALLSDFCQFVYEALSCSRRGKLTVSYALLRKALLEDLAYLEWLVARPEELLTTFYGMEPEDLDRSSRSREIHIATIAEALARTGLDAALEPEVLYDVRYGSHESTFASPGNQAMHLVTTRNPMNRTLKQNFNFVFSDADARASQWTHLYSMLPGPLFYGAELSELLMAGVLGEPMPDYEYETQRRALGWILWAGWLRTQNDVDEQADPLADMKLNCRSCGAQIGTSRTRCEALFYGKPITCEGCGAAADLRSVEWAS